MTIEDKAEQLKQLVRTGKTKGYVLYDEIDELLPAGYEGGPELDDILSELARNGTEVLEEPRAERDKEFNEDDESLDENELQELSEQAGDAPALRMYLRQVLATPHLTREQEIDLAKRISGGGEDAEDAERQLIEANLRLVNTIEVQTPAGAIFGSHGNFVVGTVAAPEPGTIMLLTVGLVAVGSMRRRMKTA